jgi:hypothetical protein
MDPLPGNGSTMSLATRLPRPSRGIALLLVGLALSLLIGLGSRTTAQASVSLPASSATGAALALQSDVTDGVTVATPAEHVQRQSQRVPLAVPTSIVVTTLALAAAVATGLRYTITSVPDAGRATAGLRPPPLLRA